MFVRVKVKHGISAVAEVRHCWLTSSTMRSFFPKEPCGRDRHTPLLSSLWIVFLYHQDVFFFPFFCNKKWYFTLARWERLRLGKSKCQEEKNTACNKSTWQHFTPHAQDVQTCEWMRSNLNIFILFWRPTKDIFTRAKQKACIHCLLTSSWSPLPVLCQSNNTIPLQFYYFET